MKGMITNIQHYCYHDGPGIRTTVFLKGCSLRCRWCSNPENLERKPQLEFDRRKCVGVSACGRCLKAPQLAGVISADSEDGIRIDWRAAMQLQKEDIACCFHEALTWCGEEKSVEDVFDEIMLDYPFYQNSGGGVTLSGGEALMQPAFAAALLAACKRQGISTAIETAGNVPQENLEMVLPHVDVLIHDIKMMDSDAHHHWTGVDNGRILENFAYICDHFPKLRILVRTPVIPGVNDSIAALDAIVDFIRPFREKIHIDYELLKYHKLGLGKYGSLGLLYSMAEVEPPDEDEWGALQNHVAARWMAEG